MRHVPVLRDECIDGLKIKPDGIFLDGTFGRGGHSLEIVKRLSGGKLIAIDRDEAAFHEAAGEFKEYGETVIFQKGNFADLGEILDSIGIPKVDGMLFDFGVSSPQLDDEERGFAYSVCSVLDMRMDRSQSLSAYDAVNGLSEQELKRILYSYGEERYTARIVSKIISKRQEAPIRTTFELNDIIRSAMPAAALREKQHPSKRTYQALRIFVNDELGSIESMLECAPDRLNTGGRICVISFHSLEDRLVKNAFSARENGCTCPRDFPVCVCGFKRTLKVITKKPISPCAEESAANPRARSAKLRIAERV